MFKMRRWTVHAGRFLIIAVAAIAWELTGRLALVDPDLLPPLSKVLAVLWRLVHDETFLDDIRVTVLECLVAFAIVAPLGLGFGFLVGESRRLDRMLGPALQILLTVPKSIFLPVFVLMFGIGFSQKVIFAVAIAFFIVVPTGIAAVHSVSRALVTAVESFGATRRQIYLQVYLPAMAPLIVGGVRLGLIFTVHGVIFAEMYGASAGIGRSILLWGEQAQMDYLFAAVLLVVVFTVLLNEFMQFCESYSRARFNAEAVQ